MLKNKVILISVDGMRPDGFLTCNNPFEECGDEYTVIVTANHGGHDRMHGTDLPEDTTIPMFYFGKQLEAAKCYSGGSILDIAPTIAKIMGVDPAPEWEGKAII